MSTGHPGLDAALKISSIPSDEPKFILRAQDTVAADAVRAWVALYLSAGGFEAVAESALQQADAMEKWSPKKVPNDTNWSDAERKQLVYQFNQRAWRLHGDDADLRIRLAEQRAYMQLKNQMRKFLASALAAEIYTLKHVEVTIIANVFRRTGEDIAGTREAEQAFVIGWLLRLGIDHGDRWRTAMHREILARLKTLAGATDLQTGAAA